MADLIWRLKKFIVFVFLVSGILLVAVSSFGPQLKENLNIKADKVDIILPIPLTNFSLEMNNVDISTQSLPAYSTNGWISIAIAIVLGMIWLKPLDWLTGVRHKYEINVELSKMDKTLTDLKRMGHTRRF